MAAITRNSRIAVEQVPFANFPGGGMTNQGASAPYPAFNDPSLEIGDVRQVLAVYQMYGNEVANDLINIYLAQPGEMVDPAYSSVVSSGIAATATLDIGDDDTTGFGLVSQGATPQGADVSRYASGLNVAAASTSPVGFASGSSLADPHFIGATAQESAAAGGTVSGAWIQARLSTLATVVPGKVLIFRLRLIKP